MASIQDCMVDILKKYGVSIKDVMSDPILKEEFETATKVLNTLDQEKSKLIDESRANVEKINDTTYSEATKRLLRSTQKSIYERMDTSAKVDTFVTRIIENSPTAKALGKNLQGTIRKLEHIKRGTENMFNAVFLQNIVNHQDKALAKSALALYKKMGRKILNTASSKKEYEDVMKAIFRYNFGESVDDIIPDKDMANTVKVLHDSIVNTQKVVLTKKKNSGMIIGEVENYLWKNTYDKGAISQLGEQGFADLMERTVSPESFLGYTMQSSKEARDIFYKDLYHKMMTTTGQTTSEEVMTAVIANSTKSRKFKFNNADSAFEVFSTIGGNKDLHGLLRNDFADSASVISNFNLLGAKADGALLEAVEKLKSFNVKSKIDSGDKALSREQILNRYTNEALQDFKVLTQRPKTAFGIIGNIALTLRNLSMSKLGATAVTQAPFDMLTLTHTVMADRGNANAFAVMAENFNTWTKVVKLDKEARWKLQHSLGIMNSIHDSTAISRMSGDLNIAPTAGSVVAEKTGQMSTMAIKFSGLDHITDVNMTTSGIQASNTLSQAFRAVRDGKLNASLASTLKDGGFTTKDIDILAGNFEKIKGLDAFTDQADLFVDPLKIYDIDDKFFGANATAKKEMLVDKMIGFINDRSRQGTPMPSIFTSIGRNKDVLTDMDAVFGAVMQFKGTLITMTDDFIRRSVRMHDNLSLGDKGMFYGTMLGGSMGMFLAVDTLSSALLDREAAWQKFARGDVEGAAINFFSRTSPMPILTDPMFRLLEQRNKWGQSAISDSLMGPIGSFGRDLENVFKSKDKSKAGMTFVNNHLVPFNSNWMLRGAGRNLFGYDIRTMKPTKGKGEFIKGSALDLILGD